MKKSIEFKLRVLEMLTITLDTIISDALEKLTKDGPPTDKKDQEDYLDMLNAIADVRNMRNAWKEVQSKIAETTKEAEEKPPSVGFIDFKKAA